MNWTAGLDIEKEGKQFYIKGSGNTREEAIIDCLRQVREHISVYAVLAKNVAVPEDVLPKVPADLPPDRGLLILQTVSRRDDEKYEWRFFAIPYGTFTLMRRGIKETFSGVDKAIGEERRVGECLIGPIPFKWIFFEPDSLYEFPLPEGSQEFVNGAWVSRKSADYFY